MEPEWKVSDKEEAKWDESHEAVRATFHELELLREHHTLGMDCGEKTERALAMLPSISILFHYQPEWSKPLIPATKTAQNILNPIPASLLYLSQFQQFRAISAIPGGTFSTVNPCTGHSGCCIPNQIAPPFQI